MFIFKEGQRVYLTAWEYNTARMLGKLAEIVEQKGGEVKPSIKVRASYQCLENDEPREIWGTGHISFLHNGIVYDFSVDDNMFFDHLYGKMELVNGKYYRNVYYAGLSRQWMINPLLRTDCTDEQCAEAAGILFGLLMEAKMSEKYVDNGRKAYLEWSDN